MYSHVRVSTCVSVHGVCVRVCKCERVCVKIHVCVRVSVCVYKRSNGGDYDRKKVELKLQQKTEKSWEGEVKGS